MVGRSRLIRRSRRRCIANVGLHVGHRQDRLRHARPPRRIPLGVEVRFDRRVGNEAGEVARRWKGRCVHLGERVRVDLKGHADPERLRHG